MGLKYTRVTPAGDPTNGPGRQPVLLWHDVALLGAIILDIPLNVVCVDPLAPKLARIFEQEIPEGRFASPSGEEESELFELAQNVEVLLTRGRAVGANLIEKARGRLKLVHVLGRHPLQVDRAAARTAGVTVATMPHGDEQEGTLAITSFAKELDPAALRGAVIGVPVMNVGAFEAMARGNPRDTHTYDMNRIYPGKPKGYLTDRIAHVHDEVIGALADMELTIHSGGNICYLGETIFTSSGDEKSLELARAMGADWSIILDTPHPP